jgi:hypothetical protein
MKRIIAIASSILFLVSVAQPASADDAYLPEEVFMEGESTVFSVSEEGTGGLSTSVLVADREGRGKGYGSWNCDSVTDPACDVPKKAEQLWGATVFGICETDADVNCVEAFEIALPGQEMQSATFVEQPGGITIPPNEKIGYPGGETPTLWSAPHAPTESGATEYMVNFRVGGSYDPRYSKSWRYGGVTVNVIPYKIVTGDYKEPTQGGKLEEDGTSHYGLGGSITECIWTDAGRCGRQQDLVEGTKIKVVVRAAKEIGGWFRGRMKDPIINISSHNATHNRIAVQAEAVTIQKLAYVTKNEDMTAKEKEFLSQSSGPAKYGRGSWWPASYRGIFDYIKYFSKKVNDTAAGTNVVWSFGSVDSGRGSQCLSDSDRVLGFVTTNAMGFDGASPSYKNGMLSYNLGGLHFNPDGETEFLGVYDLVMRADVARCLYGFNKAPVGASITISGEGDKNIATTVVGEKNGWLKLAAYGFTFSNKTIKVKLTQKKTTITCVTTKKPIKTKKVTGYSPKCPTGYKKK